MKKLKFEQGVWDGKSNLEVSDETIKGSPYREYFLENVEITIKDNGIIEVVAEEVEFDFNMYNSDEEEYLDLVEDKYIKTQKRLFSKKTYKYVPKGWVSLKKRKEFKLISNALTIGDIKV